VPAGRHMRTGSGIDARLSKTNASPRRTVAAVIESLTPHIVVRGAARAAEWYAAALGAREVSRVPVPDGRVMSLELRFGEAPVMVADEFPEMGVLGPESIGGTPAVLHVVTDDVEALWQRAVGAGAEVLHPLADGFWGERHGQLTDPFGHRWGLAQRVRDVPHEEVVRAAAAAFGA
jgi:PhnB protein